MLCLNDGNNDDEDEEKSDDRGVYFCKPIMTQISENQNKSNKCNDFGTEAVTFIEERRADCDRKRIKPAKISAALTIQQNLLQHI
jgi:hypothetical protein